MTTETAHQFSAGADSAPEQGVGVATTRGRARAFWTTSVVVKGRTWLRGVSVLDGRRKQWDRLLIMQPPSLATLLAYARAGGWVPGERPDWVEWPSKVYGAVTLLLTAVLYALAWVLRLPTRLAVAVLVVFLIVVLI